MSSLLNTHEDLPVVLLTRDVHAERRWIRDLERALVVKGAEVVILPLSTFTRVGKWRCLVNRCSDAASPFEIKRVVAALRSAEMCGVSTVNGLSCFAVGTSKLLHHELFDLVGVESPRWLQVSSGARPSDVIKTVDDAGLQYPLLLKPNSGGFGAGIVSITCATDLTEDILEVALETDGFAVLQEFETSRGGYIYRVFFIDSKVQCAVRVRATDLDGFNACVCSTAYEYWECPSDVADSVSRMAKAAGADCGSVELMYTSGSRPLYFDFNLLSTMPNERCYEDLADFILKGL